MRKPARLRRRIGKLSWLYRGSENFRLSRTIDARAERLARIRILERHHIAAASGGLRLRVEAKFGKTARDHDGDAVAFGNVIGRVDAVCPDGRMRGDEAPRKRSVHLLDGGWHGPMLWKFANSYDPHLRRLNGNAYLKVLESDDMRVDYVDFNAHPNREFLLAVVENITAPDWFRGRAQVFAGENQISRRRRKAADFEDLHMGIRSKRLLHGLGYGCG